MRTSIVLALIAAALLGYILVFERGSVSTREREERKGSALPEFVRARVSKLEIQRKGATTVVSRDLAAEVDDDAALWQVQTPYHAKADQEALLAQPGAGPFGPSERPMSSYVTLPAAWSARKATPWITKALEHVAAMPPKQPKKKAAKKQA